MNTIINVIALVIGGSRRHASTRYRVIQYTDRLKQDGIHVKIIHAKTKTGTGLLKLIGQRNEESDILKLAKNSNVTIIQKRLFRTGFIHKLKKTGTKLIFDMDDALTSGAGQNKNWSAYTEWRLRFRTKTILSNADMVFAGSAYLARQAQTYTSNVVVVPTSVEIDKYKPSSHVNDFSLCYIGQTRLNTYPDLAPIYPVIRKLTDKYPLLKLHIISSAPVSVEGINIVFHQWSEETEATLLSSCSVGISPMDDNDFTRGRCGLKLLQYMAAGLPVVCSPVGANIEIIRHGVDGFLARSLDDWEFHIDNLISDRNLRISMGRSGRNRASQEYSIDVVYKSILNAIKSLGSKKQGTP